MHIVTLDEMPTGRLGTVDVPFIHDGIHVTDSVGQRLSDLEAAKMEAVRIAGEFALRPSMMGGHGGAVVVVIRDAPNSVVMTIRMAFNVVVADRSVRSHA